MLGLLILFGAQVQAISIMGHGKPVAPDAHMPCPKARMSDIPATMSSTDSPTLHFRMHVLLAQPYDPETIRCGAVAHTQQVSYLSCRLLAQSEEKFYHSPTRPVGNH
jgi:hypothetical protein